MSKILKYKINTKLRICAFFAECSAETDYGYGLIESADLASGVSVTRTNLNKWFDKKDYGSKYRGAGVIHLTWDYNYKSFQDWFANKESRKDVNITGYGHEYVARNYPWDAGIAYWDFKGLNRAADTGDIYNVTYVVNSGMTDKEYAKRETAFVKWKNNYNFPF